MKKFLTLLISGLFLTSCAFPLPSVKDPDTNTTTNTETTPTTETTTTEITSQSTSSTDPTTSQPTSDDTPVVTKLIFSGDMNKKSYITGEEWNYQGIEVYTKFSNNRLVLVGDLEDLKSDNNYKIAADPQYPVVGTTKITINVTYTLDNVTSSYEVSDLIVKDENSEAPTNFVSPNEYSLSNEFPNNYEEYSEVYPYLFQHTPATGDVNILVIPVAFTDSRSDTQTTLNDINTAFNGTEKETGWHSVSTYFKQSSYETFNPSFTLADEWYQSSYSTSTLKIGDANTTIELLKEAVNWYKKNHSDSECREFDSNNDGFIDSVFLIYAANSDSNSNLWAYSFSVQEDNASTVSPTPNMFIWASYDFMYGNYAGSRKIDIDAHTFIHEFGHNLGLDDYYDYNYKSFPLGGFDMQEYNVGDHNSFTKFALGWSKPYVVNGEAEITIYPASTTKDQSILIPVGGLDEWNKSPFDEYLLLELYTPEGLHYFDTYNETYNGYPQGPTIPGLRLYHVDARLYESSITSQGYLNDIGYATSISEDYYYEVAATNSTGGDYQSNYEAARNFNLLKLISSTANDNFSSTNFIYNSDLFIKGDTFSMDTFKRCFPNGTKFNNKKSLNISFEVIELSKEKATIRFHKES